MAGGKWIDGLTAELPVTEAARLVFEVRFEPICRSLERVKQHPQEEPEDVHQLRVGTRRAVAALKIFEDWLPRKRYRKARHRLRRLRRAAGAARDWDVFVASLTAKRRTTPRQQPGIDWLEGYALGQRVAAQAQIDGAESSTSDFGRFVHETIDTVGEPRRRNHADRLEDLSRPLLADLLDELHKALKRDLKEYEQLHKVRIAGKKLRYAMEVFAVCFPASFREELYPVVEELQEILGDANDSHLAGERLACLRNRLRASYPKQWARVQSGFSSVTRSNQSRLPRLRKRFLGWIKSWHAGPERTLQKLTNGE